MKFDDKYPDAKAFDQFGDMMLCKREGPCWNCLAITRWAEINFGAYLCSEECLEQKDREFLRDVRKGGPGK